LSRKRNAGIAAGDRGAGCEIAAGAVAGDADAAFIAAELVDAADDVARRRKGVLERAGKAPVSITRLRACRSWVSRSPATQPPPWKNTIVGASPSPLR
jgi:hypothetical protein